MLALRKEGSTTTTIVQGFPYDLCSHGVDPQVDDFCSNLWNKFLFKNGTHPCDEQSGIKHCCHFWTKQIENNLEVMMTVMKLAMGRGQNLIELQELLEPFKSKDPDSK